MTRAKNHFRKLTTFFITVLSKNLNSEAIIMKTQNLQPPRPAACPSVVGRRRGSAAGGESPVLNLRFHKRHKRKSGMISAPDLSRGGLFDQNYGTAVRRTPRDD